MDVIGYIELHLSRPLGSMSRHDSSGPSTASYGSGMRTVYRTPGAPRRKFAPLVGGERIEEEEAGIGDGTVTGREVVLGAVDDGAHAHLHHRVLVDHAAIETRVVAGVHQVHGPAPSGWIGRR